MKERVGEMTPKKNMEGTEELVLSSSCISLVLLFLPISSYVQFSSGSAKLFLRNNKCSYFSNAASVEQNLLVGCTYLYIRIFVFCIYIFSVCISLCNLLYVNVTDFDDEYIVQSVCRDTSDRKDREMSFYFVPNER